MMHINGTIDLSDIFVPLSDTSSYNKILTEKFSRPFARREGERNIKKSFWSRIKKDNSKEDLTVTTFGKYLKLS